jgi:hypothetical protein
MVWSSAAPAPAPLRHGLRLSRQPRRELRGRPGWVRRIREFQCCSTGIKDHDLPTRWRREHPDRWHAEDVSVELLRPRKVCRSDRQPELAHPDISP